MKLIELKELLATHGLLQSVQPVGRSHALDEITISGVHSDSREIREGWVFVALQGMRVDGHNFSDKAEALGASALLVSKPVSTQLPQFLVHDSAKALGLLAAALSGNAKDKLCLVGITGTNGKTTSAFLVEAMLAHAGKSTGVVGTVSYRYGGKEYSAPYTTPTPEILHGTLADMVAHETSHGVFEVSSAALEMGRLAAINFDVAAFTNLTQDHLDLHGSMEAYLAAKQLLFSDHLSQDGTAVINIDGPYGQAMVDAAQGKALLRVSNRQQADAEITLLSSESTIAGIRASFATPIGTINISNAALIGQYNVDNLGLAVGVGIACGLNSGEIAAGLSAMRGVPGRVERVANQRGINAFVDYAHTPDALVNVLAALRPLTEGRLICVFGCGGDRDPGKRPKMGKAVSDAADLAIVTSDNPRTEEPRSIIDMILPAVANPHFVDPDRRTAIRAAMAAATSKDVVLIAGKGHEDYQILGTEKIHFDDRQEAAAAIADKQSHLLSEIADYLGLEGSGDEDPEITRVIIDGRTAASGDLYVAIRGQHHDGHDFCQQAVDAGACALLVESGADTDFGVPTIKVQDSRAALGLIARGMRREQACAVVGLTGSSGKTTTKALAAAALSSQRCVLSPRGSLNNETGVPLSLMSIRDYHDVAIIEMGMRGLGQIDYLCQLAEPEIGVVVNAGSAHLGELGSLQNIARAKGEVYGRLPPRGTAIYPHGDSRLDAYSANVGHRISFGTQREASVCLVSRQVHVDDQGIAVQRCQVAVAGEEIEFSLGLLGAHNAINACCALAIAKALGLEIGPAAKAMRHCQPDYLRGQTCSLADRHFYLDCYNANPEAMKASLATLAEMPMSDGALVVLADMLEIGESAQTAHREIGTIVAAYGFKLVALGQHAQDYLEGFGDAGDRAVYASDHQDAATKLMDMSTSGDWILVKASRGMKLEQILDHIPATKPESN